MAMENTRKAGKGCADDYLDGFRKACQALGINRQTCDAVYLPLAQEWLQNFAVSSLGQPLPGELWEQPFALEWPAKRTTVRFRGFIDQLIPRQDGKWDLIDYKTNRVLDPAEIRDYTLQLQLYALACRQALGLQVGGLYLYHFPKGALLKIDDDAGVGADAGVVSAGAGAIVDTGASAGAGAGTDAGANAGTSVNSATAIDILTKVGDAIAAGETEISFKWPDRGCRHCPVAVCPLRDEEKTEFAEEEAEPGDQIVEPASESQN